VFDEFKESVHAAYALIGRPFIDTQNFDVARKVYQSMLETTKECIRISKHSFDKGFEYSNLGITEFALGNLEKGFSHMELALIEDERIGNVDGVAKSHVGQIVSGAYQMIDDLMRTSSLLNMPSAAVLFTRLDWSLKCRLAKSLWRFHYRLRDSRSSLNKDDLEGNLLSVCKVVENYLKAKLPKPTPDHRKLGQLIDVAFSRDQGKHPWYSEWNRIPKGYDGSTESERRLIGSLSDKARRYETNIFLVLSIIRNFSAHIFNDQSDLFLEANYDKAFSMCIEALMYTLAYS